MSSERYVRFTRWERDNKRCRDTCRENRWYFVELGPLLVTISDSDFIAVIVYCGTGTLFILGTTRKWRTKISWSHFIHIFFKNNEIKSNINSNHFLRKVWNFPVFQIKEEEKKGFLLHTHLFLLTFSLTLKNENSVFLLRRIWKTCSLLTLLQSFLFLILYYTGAAWKTCSYRYKNLHTS